MLQLNHTVFFDRWGLAIGIYVASAIGIWYLQRVDWEYEVKQSLERLSINVSKQHDTDLRLPLLTESCGDNVFEYPDQTMPNIV